MKLDTQMYTNHSVVYVGDIGSTGLKRLQCQGARNCCGTEGHWYYPDGTPVRNFTTGGTTLYMTRGGDNQNSLYLHKDSTAQAVALSEGRGVGLYRCQLPASGTNGVIQIIYIGVYRAGGHHGKGKFVCRRLSSTDITIHFTHRKTNSGFPDISPGCSQYCSVPVWSPSVYSDL